MKMCVTKKSTNGFQLDNDDKWFTIDKFKVSREQFNSLKVGQVLEDFKLNKNGFVTSFTVEGVFKVEEASKVVNGMHIGSLQSLPPSPVIKASDCEREILKGQCLNLAFKDIDVFDDKVRERAIKLSQKLFVELEDADYYSWSRR